MVPLIAGFGLEEITFILFGGAIAVKIGLKKRRASRRYGKRRA